MGRLSAAKPRLGSMPSRLGGVSDTERKGVRRSDGPVNTAKWQKLRVKILFRDAECFQSRPHLVPLNEWPDFKRAPLFRDHPWLWPVCQQTGVLLIGGKHAPNSAVIDHKRPHRGDLRLFWDENNLQAVSKEYHDRVKQSIEKRGRH